MNNNWQRVKLDDVCDLIAGFAFKGKDFGEEFQSKVIKIADIQPPNVKMDSLTGIDVSKYDESKLQKYRVGIGDYVFAMTGATIGKLGRIQEGEAYINQRVLTFRNNLNVCDKDFLYYVLAQPSFLGYILNHIDSETAQPNISASSVGTFEFYLPPISTQKQIANALRGLDDKIELNNKINRNLEAQAQAIFKSWFIDFEPFKNGKFIDSELGKIPEGWSVSKLTNSLNIKYGKNLPQSKLTKTGYPVYGANGQIGFFPQIMYKKPQVLISCRGAASGKVITSEKNSFITNNSLILDYSDTTIPFSFVKYWALSTDFSPYVSGSAQPQITIDSLSTMNLTIPDEIILKKFNNIVIPILDKIFSNNAEIIRLSQLRDVLLPRLLSGEINISDYIV